MSLFFHRLPAVNAASPTGQACKNSTWRWPRELADVERARAVRLGEVLGGALVDAVLLDELDARVLRVALAAEQRLRARRAGPVGGQYEVSMRSV